MGCRGRGRDGSGDLTSVEVVSLAGTMQSVIPLDGVGQPVRTAILYSDSRADEVFRRLAPAFEALHAGAVLGNHIDELMSVFKIAWMKEHQPGSICERACFTQARRTT